MCFFFFKQKKADEMRISDWSADVCSSDLPDVRTRLLIAVITGGRPLLTDRPTRRFFESLRTLGDIEYVVREDQAADYEDDPGVPLNTYPVAWADRYERTHWSHPRADRAQGGAQTRGGSGKRGAVRVDHGGLPIV